MTKYKNVVIPHEQPLPLKNKDNTRTTAADQKTDLSKEQNMEKH